MTQARKLSLSIKSMKTSHSFKGGESVEVEWDKLNEEILKELAIQGLNKKMANAALNGRGLHGQIELREKLYRGEIGQQRRFKEDDKELLDTFRQMVRPQEPSVEKMSYSALAALWNKQRTETKNMVQEEHSRRLLAVNSDNGPTFILHDEVSDPNGNRNSMKSPNHNADEVLERMKRRRKLD